MKVINQEEYDKWKANNADPYGAASFRFIERWANVMESKLENGEKLVDIAEKSATEADTEGITGFMYGCAVSVLSQCWIYGEELREWHNKEYRYEGDGVVNPAVLTIG